ncbi:MAG: L-seryl-tRNA(Sec) selenium transferase [Sedimentitalea sp.]
MTTQLKNLPQINMLLTYPSIQQVASAYSHSETVSALRHAIAALRHQILTRGTAQLPDFAGPAFAATLVKSIQAERRPSLRSVVNATGILIHTNLGRARLAPQALQAMQDAAANPTNLELSLADGKRGSRHDHVEKLICDLTGAQAAVVVNNCAAAVLLALMGTASGRNVVASRGELIEIGGSFRLPDVIAQSGAILREVGTTNKTRLDDYSNAIDPDTAVLLKSHTSNFKIVGFTSAPARRDLGRLASESGVLLVEDLGSGVLMDLSPYGLVDEPVVRTVLAQGVDLVMFSGDKLLGGPQAGILAGRRDIIAALKAHPLMRAVRIDKLSLAALEATLRLYRAPFDPVRDVPVLAMLSEPVDCVRARAQTLADALHGFGLKTATVQPSAAQIGAGAMPEQDLPSFAVALTLPNLTADALMDRLRTAQTPVIARIEHGQVLFDMRTVRDDELGIIAATLSEIAAQ